MKDRLTDYCVRSLLKCAAIVLFTMVLPYSSAGLIAAPAGSRADTVQYNLPEIVVTASSIPAIGIVQEIGPENLKSVNARTAADAFSNAVGMNVQVGTSRGDVNVWMRGFRQRDILLLLDGIPISSAYEGDIDLNEIGMEGLGRIKIVKGAPSAVYGVNGLGGVIDLVPISPSDGQAVDVSVQVSQNNERAAQATLAKRTKSVSFLASGGYQSSDGYPLAESFTAVRNEDGGIRNNSDFSRKQVLAILDMPMGSVGSSSIVYNYADNERGHPPQVGIDEPDFERRHSQRQAVGLVNKFSKVPISSRFFFVHSKRTISQYSDSTYGGLPLDDESKDYSYGSNVFGTISFNRYHFVTLGAFWKNDVYESATEMTMGNEASLRNYALAVEDHVMFHGALSIAVGGAFGLVEQTHNERTIRVTNPQIEVGYEIRPDVTAYVAAAHRTRFPTLREFFRKKYGNPDLTEEKAINYQAGVKCAPTETSHLTVELFYNDVSGLIERMNQKSIYVNLDRSTFRGVEALFEVRPTSNVSAGLGYTYLDAFENSSINSSRPLRNRPKHLANAEIRYHAFHGIDLSARTLYAARTYDYDDRESLIKLPNYLIIGAKISCLVRDHLSFYATMDNMTDQDYYQRVGFPMEGRTTHIGFEITD